MEKPKKPYMKLVDREEEEVSQQVKLTADYLKWLLNDKEALEEMITNIYADLNRGH